MLVGLVFAVLITIKNNRISLLPFVVLNGAEKQHFPQFCVQQNNLITLTEGKFVFLFPFQRAKTKRLRTVDV